MNTSNKTRKLTTMAMLAALAVVLTAMIHFPLLPAAPFLEYDPADIPIFLCTFLYGTKAGLLLTIIVSVIQGFTVSAASGVIGVIMHVLATGSFVLIAGLVYRKNHTRKGAAMALIAGTITMTVVMCICNLIFTPIFMGAPMESVIQMLIPAIIPFNFLKAGINSVITFLVYKPLRNFMHIR